MAPLKAIRSMVGRIIVAAMVGLGLAAALWTLSLGSFWGEAPGRLAPLPELAATRAPAGAQTPAPAADPAPAAQRAETAGAADVATVAATAAATPRPDEAAAMDGATRAAKVAATLAATGATTEAAADADPAPGAATPAPPAAPAPAAKNLTTTPAKNPSVAPSFDVVRVEADGAAVLAGRARPGASVDVLLDDKVVETVVATGRGEFVAFADLPPSRVTRRLSLRATDSGGVTEAVDTVLILGDAGAAAEKLEPAVTAAMAPAVTPAAAPVAAPAAAPPVAEAPAGPAAIPSAPSRLAALATDAPAG
ncbi:MAG: hypothetical protein ACI9ZH_002319, partial [Paracoccaceae bacterium]